MSGGRPSSPEPIRVRVPDEGWAPVVRGLFPSHRVVVSRGPGTGSRFGGGRWMSLEEREGGYLLRGGGGVAFEGEDALRVEDPGAAISALELAIARSLLADHSDRVQLHAAGVRIGEMGVVALGPAGAGKSSLALEWSRSGWPLLGDDAVLVDPEGTARAFPRLIKVDVERLAGHGIRPEDTHAWVPGSEEAWLDPRVGGGWSAGACPVVLVVLLDRDGEDVGRGVRTEDVETPAALAALLASALPGGLEGARAVDPLRRLLDGSRILRLSYRSSREAARFLVREAGGGRAPHPTEDPEA